MNLIKVAFGVLLVALCIMLGSVGQRDDYALDGVIEPSSKAKPDKILESREAILDFIESGNYTYSENRNDIPQVVLDSIFKFGDNREKFCDKNTRDSFSSGCSIFPPQVYSYLLDFVAYNDSQCLISYEFGGFSSGKSVEFVKFKEITEGTSFGISDYQPSDILMLKAYLTEYPNITKLNKNPFSGKHIYIKDINDYYKTFIKEFKYYFGGYDTVALLQDSIIINRDVKNFIKIPTDLPLNKKVTYKGKKGKSSYTLDITRINFSTIKYAYQKVNQGKTQYISKGEADLQPSFYLGTQGIFNDAKDNIYGMNEYITPKSKKQEVIIFIGVGSIEKSFIKFQHKNGKATCSPKLTIQ